MKDPLHELRREAEGCRACPLWENATQTVFGEGDSGAEAMLVGEQPGDEQDIAGRPFVGPSGRLLDVFATLHPSALLRLRDEEEKETAFRQLVSDLGLIRKALAPAASHPTS